MAGKSETERFWAGDFGDSYTKRQVTPEILAANMNLFCRALSTAPDIASILEFGANAGQNLWGLKRLFPQAHITGVEINRTAWEQLRKIDGIEAVNESILDFKPTQQYDLVFTKTVLIHIPPSQLEHVYELMFQATKRFLMVAEYFNPRPETIEYRGHSEKLFRRDFAGDLLDRYSSLSLRDYGFAYKRDKHSQDNVTWFLLEKNG
jgi:pseudaminic acid biosynthesis-associated methylase